MSLINKTNVRCCVLVQATRLRPAAGFERVGQSFYDRLEAKVRNMILDEIHRHPSNGKTIK
jgi:hypothetical protein